MLVKHGEMLLAGSERRRQWCTAIKRKPETFERNIRTRMRGPGIKPCFLYDGVCVMNKQTFALISHLSLNFQMSRRLIALRPETSRASPLSVVGLDAPFILSFPWNAENQRDCAVYNQELFMGTMNANWTKTLKADNKSTYVTSLWTAGTLPVFPLLY